MPQPLLREPSPPLSKLSKDAVLYSARRGVECRCGTCRYFVPPARCMLVEGQVSAQGTCEHASISAGFPEFARSEMPVLRAS